MAVFIGCGDLVGIGECQVSYIPSASEYGFCRADVVDVFINVFSDESLFFRCHFIVLRGAANNGCRYCNEGD